MFNGARILNTRMAGRNTTLSQLIRERGGDVVELPLLEAVHHEISTECISWLLQFQPDGWVVVTSPTGAEALRNSGVHCRIACIGESTAAVLRDAGIAIDFVPEREDSHGFVLEFIERYGTASQVGLYRGSTATRALPEFLRKAGVTVSEWVAYTIRPREVLNQKQFMYFMEEPGATVVSSPLGCELLLRFASGFGSLMNVPIVTIGPTTSSSAKKLGFKRVIESRRANDHGIVSALEKILAVSNG